MQEMSGDVSMGALIGRSRSTGYPANSTELRGVRVNRLGGNWYGYSSRESKICEARQQKQNGELWKRRARQPWW